MLRRALDGYASSARTWPTKAEEWAADLAAYDELLVAAARARAVEVPPPARLGCRLTHHGRRLVEARLAAAGLNVRGREP
jgi:hypothetical protein